MKRHFILCISLITFCTCIWADTYTIVFNSGDADSSSKTSDLEDIILSATNNCIDEILLANYIYRAKSGYGIKGGTSSNKGELTLGLNYNYHINTITVYAACYANKTDSTKDYGITVCDQLITWEQNHPTAIRPYTLSVNKNLDAIAISANNPKNNRWYISKIEFEAQDPRPDMAVFDMPYTLDLGSQAIVDGEPIKDVANIIIKGKNVIGNIHLALNNGKHFSITQTQLDAIGGEVNLAYSLDYVGKVTDTLIVSGSGTSGITTIQKMPITLSGYIYKPPVFDVDSSCMAIGPMPGFYYEEAQGQKDSVLKSKLGEIIYCGVRYKYGSGNKKTWNGFYHTDRDTSNNQVLDMYSNEIRYFDPNDSTASVSGIDIEHMFPKSWWGGDVNEAYCDLFHLVPADYSANRSKSNHAPGIPSDTTFWNGSFATGNGEKYGLSKVFCPDNEYKGDFARAYFYIVTCYGDSLRWEQNGEPASTMTNEHWQEFQPWLRELLIEWHRQDPVSQKEKQRAIEVNKIQGNRNPFIDYPDLAEYIWGDKQGIPVDFYLLEQTFGNNYGEPNNQSTSIVTNETNTRKIIKDNHIFIYRNGIKYTILGISL